MRKSNTESFIQKAKVVHGDRYGYDKVMYRTSKTKVIITCPHHGGFLQEPTSHLAGTGCPTCGGTCKSNTESFIRKSKAVHGEKYGYENVLYKNAYTKVIISCPHHGNFGQKPQDHLKGQGCQICGGTCKSTTEDFIRKAKKVHGNKYTYDKVVYKIAHTKVIIGCKRHGDFLQTPNRHLSGDGCPICGSIQSAYSYYREPTLLYYIYFPTLNIYKIGITVERIGVAKRFANDKIQFIVVSTRRFADGIEAYEIEQLLHRKYKKFKYTETEPLIGGNSELFAIPYEELQDVYETFNVLTGHKKELNNED